MRSLRIALPRVGRGRAGALSLLALVLALVGTWQFSSGVYIHLKARLAQYLIANAWTRSLDGELQARPWPWADTWPVARLRVAKLGIDQYVLADASGRSLAFGPGVVSGSAAPGTAGNSVIAAHRDTHFSFLRDVPVGMEISLQTLDGRQHRYRVSEERIIDSRRDYLDVHAAGTTLTLLTCYPFDAISPGGPLRYIAIALPSD
jgi:sortase A